MSKIIRNIQLLENAIIKTYNHRRLMNIPKIIKEGTYDIIFIPKEAK